MSLANDPVWSNGDKTVTIKYKNWKWSDGQPVTSKDAEFWIDMIKAAVKVSPADWSKYTPKVGIPDQIDEHVHAGQPHPGDQPEQGRQPDLVLGGQPGRRHRRCPVHAWAKASANGPVLDPNNPANATKIYKFLAAQSKSVTTYATNPLWQVVDGPYKLTSFNNTTGAFTMSPNPKYSGPHASKPSKTPGRAVHLGHRRVERGQVGQHRPGLRPVH